MISVIVPHLNDPELPVCLAALDAQENVSSDWEILVVDNGSTVPPVALCKKYQRVQLFSEAAPGPGPARNKGAEVAKGDVLAFIDSDCSADPNWISSIEAAMADGELKVIGGTVEVVYKDTQRPSYTEPYERVYSFRNEKHIEEGYSATANLATRREVFEQVGGFGGREMAEDQDWGLRATALGYPPKFHPEMVVRNAPRADLNALKRKWDRHIAHDYQRSTGGFSWYLKAIALIFSPIAEVPKIAGSSELATFRERMLCFSCLCSIRFYRGTRMLSKRRTEIVWNEG